MVSVRINGVDSTIQGDGLPRVADLIELIKASIDPEHMITNILLDGAELREESWLATTASLGTAVLEVETDTPERFVIDRLVQAPSVVQACFVQFRDARKTFQTGNSHQGNQKLVRAVDTLKAFFSWYSSIFALIPQSKRAKFDIDPFARSLLEICKAICQQQLYHSWWALGESIEKQLEPKLDELEDYFRKATSDLTTFQ